MQPKHPLLQKCLRQIESLPNLKFKVDAIPYVAENFLADGQLIIYRFDKPVEYIYEIKSNVNSETVAEIIDYFIQLKNRLTENQRLLLITEELSDLIVDELININLEFIDATGNIYLNNPDIYLLVRRQPVSKYTSIEFTEDFLKIIYMLLKTPDILMQENYVNELAAYSGTLLETVELTLNNLCNFSYLQKKKSGIYKIIDYIKLLERWELGYTEILRPKLFIDTFTPISKLSFSEVSKLLIKQAKNYGYSIGGELGASLMTNCLRPISAILHVPANYRSIFVELKLKPHSQGNITFLRQFTHQDRRITPKIPPEEIYYMEKYYDKNIAAPIIIYTELLTSKDDRLRETADLIFKQYIEPRIKNVNP